MSDCGCSGSPKPIKTVPTQCCGASGDSIQPADAVELSSLAAAEACQGSCVAEGVPIEPKCPDVTSSTFAEGASAKSFLNAVPTNEMTLIGRYGEKIARFVGDGYIRIKQGKATLTQSIPMSVSRLWHKWVKTSGGTKAVLGDPSPYPFRVIADNSGTCYAVRGLTDHDSVEVYDHVAKQFYQKPVSAFPIQVIGDLPRVDRIQLTGFRKQNPAEACSETVRPIESLSGNGIVISEYDASAEADCQDFKRSFARVIGFPDDVQNYYVRYDKANGIYFEPKPELTDGASAYEVWLSLGNVGTQQDFINSLKGANAVSKSAYDIWIDLGNVGTEQDFINSLKGTNGTNGADGTDGTNGTNGTFEDFELTTTPVKASRFAIASAVPEIGGNLNVAGVLNITSFARRDDPWQDTSGSSTLVSSDQPDYVDISVNLHLKTGDTSLPANTGMSVVVELYKGAALVASAVTSQEQEYDVTESSLSLRYIDPNPAGAPVYNLITRPEGSNTTSVMTILGGQINALAHYQGDVVAAAELTEIP